MDYPASRILIREKKLRSAGIRGAEELIQAGSKEAVWRLKAQYSSACVVILYHLHMRTRPVAPNIPIE
ncbi:MAG: TfoX/Sxy family protein [Synergistaceae bacterium]|nr:TfoX/Sxy family protein [Synergistaceae bacterium]